MTDVLMSVVFLQTSRSHMLNVCVQTLDRRLNSGYLCHIVGCISILVWMIRKITRIEIGCKYIVSRKKWFKTTELWGFVVLSTVSLISFS